ncbi:MAG: hypothetical protein AAB400_03130 [Patescibacteria group bacterium]|mgnify:CR=1 FL=1
MIETSPDSMQRDWQGSCPHGVPVVSFCQPCTAESQSNQPAWKDIEKLRGMSKFTRSNNDSPSCTLDFEGKKYQIEHVESGESPTLSEVQDLFIRTFGEEEVDPEEILRQAVSGVEFGVPSQVKYKVFAVRDPEGKVVCTVAGGNLDLKDEHGNPTGETMLMIAYAVTDKEVKQSGLAREAYISALMDCAAEAEKLGKKFALAAGECTYTSEKFWNKLGWKRAYIESGDKQKYTELKYVQPALDFVKKTGLPKKGAGEVPEHLMVRPMDGRTPSKDKVMSAVEAFYQWCNRWGREAFSSTKAYQANQSYVDDIAGTFKEGLDRGGQLIFLDQTNREKARVKGIKVREYIDADHGDAGKEDF